MSTSEPNAFETRYGGQGSAKGAPVGASDESLSRRHEILRADPYYPHTVLRALLLAAITFLSTVGLSVVLILMFWPREITWGLMVAPGVYAIIFAGGQLLLHKFRVGRLEDWGRISRR